MLPDISPWGMTRRKLMETVREVTRRNEHWRRDALILLACGVAFTVGFHLL